MRKNEAALAYAGIVFVNIVWGLSFIASKIALQAGFQPFTLALVRFLMSTALLLPIALAKEGMPQYTRREWLFMLLAGLSGISLYFLFEYKGLLYTTAGNASLILAAVPVMTMIVGAVTHRARYGASVWIGVVVSLAGVYLVVRYGADGDAENALLGNLLMLGACLCWVCYLELTSSLSARHSSLSLTTYQGLLASVALLPLAMSEGADLAAVSLDGWLAAAFLGVLCSAICYILYTQAVHHLQPMRTALFINLNPLSAVLGGVLMLGESVGWMQLIGGGLILSSIVYVNWRLSKENCGQYA